MIFNEIKLKNFRQFRNECSFVFSEDLEKQITLVIAKNGVGKTTLLQAFRFCFYGESPNYLKLPRADELLNTNAKNELEENQLETLSVEVKFTSNGIKYLAKREKCFEKKNGKIRATSDAKFRLFKNDILKGYIIIPEDKAIESINSLLPPGISHIFMFDGERMERKITDNVYKLELSKAVTGLLGLDKLQFASNKIIGLKNQTTSLISKLSELITTSKTEEQKIINDYNLNKASIEQIKKKIVEVTNRINESSDDINELNRLQKIVNENATQINKRDSIAKDIKILNNEKNNLIKNANETLFNTLMQKYLLKNRTKIIEYINQINNKQNFYQALHVDTLNDIKEHKQCICGTQIDEFSKEWKCIENLYKYALPNEYSSYLNKIKNDVNKGSDYSLGIDELNNIKLNIMQVKKELLVKYQEQDECIEKIIEFEKEHKLEDIQNKILKKSSVLGGYENKKANLERELYDLLNKFKKLEKSFNEIQSKGIYNSKVRRSISDLEIVKQLIDEEFDNKKKIVNRYLNIYLDKNIKLLLNKKYDAVLEDDYSIKVYDDSLSNEITDKISTGESVVISMSFIDSLLSTAKTLINEGTIEDNKYGVIMDAALSNVDELRISNLCHQVFIKMDQLIFLSFKRQLRDELYFGVKNNVGKAYILNRIENGDVLIEECDLKKLDEVIHSVEEGEE